MTRLLATTGSMFGLCAVMLGAFGAHALEEHVSPERVEVWTTAAYYLGWHGAVLLALAALLGSVRTPSPARRLIGISAWLFIAGTLIFSGSLFILVLSGISAIGALTPVGGLLLIAGWAVSALGAWRLAATD